MNLTDDKDAQLLYDIACKLQKKYEHLFSPIDNVLQSYYIARDRCKHKEIEELYFDTPVDLRKYLEKLWESEEDREMKKFIPVILAAAFKRRPVKKDGNEKSAKAEDSQLPEFVYNF
ncbi:MAG: hypothetical protein JW997_03035 [Actinobacteria bacterium]|nr:hypothetical protein [Actinomycetota bacterium]